jgi:hypothetical protein
MKGDENFSALSENVTGLLYRYPAEDGETWNVEFELLDSTSIFGSPIEFHESCNNQENCFVSSGFISCGSRSILIMWYVVCGMWYVVCGMWYVGVQGEHSGNRDIRFINNKTVYETKRFYLKPQIPPGKVPAGSAFNQGTYSTTSYDNICEGPTVNGRPSSVPCDTTYTNPLQFSPKAVI